MSEAVDPELLKVVDEYLADLRKEMIIRLEKGEKEYKGLWRKRSEYDLLKDIQEEEIDAVVYKAMIRYKTTHKTWFINKERC